MQWISVVKWREFQHYDPAKRQPPWIKNYTDLLRSDDYRGLTAGERALLHGIWLEYASSRCRLNLDTRSMTRRLNLRVTMQQLEALNHAGFIEFVASAELAQGYQRATTEVETETEEETQDQDQDQNPSVRPELQDPACEDDDWIPPEPLTLADLKLREAVALKHKNGRTDDGLQRIGEVRP